MEPTGTTRRLTPMLMADVVGYSRLMQQDEEGAARERLDQAEALFRDLGMDWWTAPPEGLRGRIDRGAEFVWFALDVDGPLQYALRIRSAIVLPDE